MILKLVSRSIPNAIAAEPLILKIFETMSRKKYWKRKVKRRFDVPSIETLVASSNLFA
jgi:hypothetical protein